LIDVVSIKFKNRGKSYYFDPNGLTIKVGQKVIVETSKGLEIADCFKPTHPVDETAVVLPLRPVVRIATSEDLRVEEICKRSEREAFSICEKKITEHGLDMKLIDVECSFDGTKTTFFFTSEGRVDFRELVKDLAGVFRNRIELRQIGVRDEAKMIGGLGICGRPYCCHQFLDDFQPVSTKMAKVQSLFLNPTKISGSCGRLMCCLRYEQDAYEDLLKKVPKQGSFVETIDGYGTCVQVNLLRQTCKVRLDNSNDDSLNVYKANELAQVPGGRPKDGEAPAKVLNYVPENDEDEKIEGLWEKPAARRTSEWDVPASEYVPAERESEKPVHAEKSAKVHVEAHTVREERGAKPEKTEKTAKPEGSEKQENGENGSRSSHRGGRGGRNHRGHRGGRGHGHAEGAVNAGSEKPVQTEKGEKPAKQENHTGHGNNHGGEKAPRREKQHSAEKPAAEKHTAEKPAGGAEQQEGAKKKNNHRRYYHHKPRQGGGNKE